MKTLSDFGIEVPFGETGEVRTTCPSCSPERNKSNEKCLAVNIAKGAWFCHHCGWSGSISKGAVDGQAIQQIRPRKKTWVRPDVKPQSRIHPAVIKWFQARGISEAVLLANGVFSGDVVMRKGEKPVLVAQMPYFREGKIINIKYRDIQKKRFRMFKGAERILYGLDQMDERQTVIVEGEFDKLALHEAGIVNAVSVPDGAPDVDAKNYASKFDFLKADEKKIKAVLRWIIAVDDDGPGHKLQEELVRRFGPARCWCATWPAGCKDANDVLIKFGPEKLKQCIDNAEPVPVEGVYRVNDFRDRIMAAYDHGIDRGLSTGWKTVDELYTVRPGEMTILTGIPSSGKSEWLDAMAVNMSVMHGWAFGVLSLENLPLERHFIKLAEKFTGWPFEAGPWSERMTPFDLETAISWGNEKFIFLVPREDSLNIDGILGLAEVLCFRHGINGMIIDPWNELDHRRPGSMNESEYISQSLGKIRRFAREHKVHVWLVAHPTKLRKKDDGTYPAPTPYDISGSAHWRNKADCCIAVHRPNHTRESLLTEIHVQKIRFKEIGKVGTAQLQYEILSGRYRELIP